MGLTPPGQKQGKARGHPAAKGGSEARPGAPRPRNQTASGQKKGPAGLVARDLAVALIHDVTTRGAMLEEALDRWTGRPPFDALEARDRAFARLITATALRRHGQINDVLAQFIQKAPTGAKGRLGAILLAAGAQVLFIGGAPHAAISLAVEQCKRDHRTQRFAKLANAVLRRVASEGPGIVSGQDEVRLNFPDWLLSRWTAAYGPGLAREMAAASLGEAALDLSVKGDGEAWARRLGGTLLATGSVRLAEAGQVEALDGYGEGEWWVQDAAAALPARLLGDVSGLAIADLCAAPGGKTAELAAQGGRVTAVESSKYRMARLRDNLTRLKLTARLVEADVLAWETPELFDAVLLDAPCSATGTIRRHPDLLLLKSVDDIARLAGLQARLLEKAAELVKPGGRLVYCSCSLEPEEGPEQIAQFLQAHPNFQLMPVAAEPLGIDPAWLTSKGELRTLPCHMVLAPPLKSGMDGFYAAVLTRNG
jgi:16S rRNA (cytosine967-C5)-methyltransferase